MTIDASGTGVWIAIVVMAIVTIATRWGGLWAMSFVPIGDRTKRFITAMSGSVLIAIIAPLALTGDAGLRLALLTTVAVMLLSRRPLPAIAAGILAAAFLRQF